ncbi:rhamnosyltransferase WsaF family glycosyltransferase [Desulfothermobacter acidiphilus]|uniref:rhamnosyltransferase WsaF family glycosyltransferase n=1 Tax=Desulfothermobacter acidiphilus TaxID=1938353 RepID=UPI003F8CCF8A
MKYQREINLEVENDSATKIIKQVGTSKKVLEVGCATGYMTKVLKEQFDCRVTCIEIDAAAAEKALPYCEQMIVGDVETLKLEDHLQPESFDVIILADVLEHLKDPWATLRKLRPFLKPDGYILASIPNVAHAGLILELLEGKFKYRPLGLLDDTHLRFFTRESIQELFEKTGYAILSWDRVLLYPDETEFNVDLEEYPEKVLDYLYTSNPEADTYQFIVKAKRAEGGQKKPLSVRPEEHTLPPGAPRYRELKMLLEEKEEKVRLLEERLGQSEHELKEALCRIRELSQQLESMKESVKQKEEELDKTLHRVQELSGRLQLLQDSLTRKEQELHDIAQRLSALQSSLPLKLLARYNRWRQRLLPEGTRRYRIYRFFMKVVHKLVDEGPMVLARKVWSRIVNYGSKRQLFSINTSCKVPYQAWILTNEPNEIELDQQRRMARDFKYRPLISVIMPVYETPVSFLDEAIRSVIEQTYDNWELCIAEGNSANPAVRKVIQKWAERDTRIRVKFLSKNHGISGNSNEALAMARGEFIALLDHDDVLAPNALFEVVSRLNQDPTLDFIYTDRDMIDRKGKRFNPLFKPSWSPEIMLSANYLTHLCVIRKSIVDNIGGFDPETDGAQDWDLFLRVTECTQRIAHIPKILYHWRAWEGSAASSLKAKPYALGAQKLAIEKYLKRKGIDAEVTWEASGFIKVLWPTTGRSRVSIIIPTTGAMQLLRPCITSILERTTYTNFEVIIVHNGLANAEVTNFYHDLSKSNKIRVLYYDKPFNYSAVNNLGAKHASGDILLFLNDDIEVISPDWLEEMARWTERPEVGVVGAKLLKPEGTIQHAGVVIGLTGFAGHIFAGLQEGHVGIFGSTEWYRNFVAVTGACMAVRKEVFWEVGGFNEDFLLCGSDVELCLRIWKKGYRVVYTPYARLLHHESATRGEKIPRSDYMLSYLSYLPLIRDGDPYYNPNLSCWSTIPTLKVAEESPFQFAKNLLSAGTDKKIQPTAAKDPAELGKEHEAKKWAPLQVEARVLASAFDFTEEDLAVNRRLIENSSTIDVRTINWFIPSFYHPHYGGIRTIFRFAEYLQENKGVENRFVVFSDEEVHSVAEKIHSYFPALRCKEVHSVSLGKIPECDAAISTLWTTAYAVLKFDKAKRKFYFIQDYEALFYPAGTISALVEATYRFGFLGIANTISLKEIYEREYRGVATFFNPCVDTLVFNPHIKKNPEEEPFRVFFYGRPNHPRNAFELGAEALKRLKQRLGRRVQILTAGDSWNPKDFDLEGVVENLGLLSYEETAAFYRQCDVGLVMMMTRHPSYLPLELMASGCLVVTNYNPATLWLLRDGENCILAHPSVSCLVDSLERGLLDIEERKRITEQALREVCSYYSDWGREIEEVYKFMCDPLNYVRHRH